jgi:hypothetical protein
MADAPSLSPRFLRRQGGDFDRVGRTLLSVAFDVDLDVDSDSDREGHGFSRTAKPPPKRDVIPLIPASRSISGCPHLSRPLRKVGFHEPQMLGILNSQKHQNQVATHKQLRHLQTRGINCITCSLLLCLTGTWFCPKYT